MVLIAIIYFVYALVTRGNLLIPFIIGAIGCVGLVVSGMFETKTKAKTKAIAIRNEL